MKATRAGVEQEVFVADEAFRAMRAVGFLLFQLEGKGNAEWGGEPMEDLGTLIRFISERGARATNEALDQLGILDVA